MKKNELKELEIAAIAARDARAIAFTTYNTACIATDDAWDDYNSACEAARKATGEFEINCYDSYDYVAKNG